MPNNEKNGVGIVIVGPTYCEHKELGSVKILGMRTHMLVVLALVLVSCKQSPASTGGSEVPATVVQAPIQAAVPAAEQQDEPNTIVTADTPIVTSEYTLELSVPNEVVVGKEATAIMSLTSAKGWKLNREFPTTLKISAPAGVSIKQEVQKLDDASEVEEKGEAKKKDLEAAKWSITFTAKTPGEKSITGLFRFAVCTDATCNPKKADLSFVVPVKPAG